MPRKSEREKNSLSEKEFKQLIELLSKRKKELQSRTSLEIVRQGLAETGLLDVLDESDIEAVQNQANKQMRRRQFRNTLLLMFVPALFISPLFIYAGYKAETFINSIQDSESLPVAATKLEEENAAIKRKNQELQARVTELEGNNEELKANLENQVNLIPTPSPSAETSSSPEPSPSLETSPTPNQSPATARVFEEKGIRFELQGCRNSDLSITRKNIYCFLSITSTKEPSFVSIYRQETGQTRILEGGEEKL
ncbi:MAG: hypothetical protein F6K14_28735, partial [Symploca sp. SIO2C1]|nr:hypothetical protein [Symploca sp. SIO2C1]